MTRSTYTPFLLIVCGLVVFGLLIFTSAALGLLARDGASFSSVTVSQLLLGLVCGGVALYVFSRVDYRKLRPYTPYFFGAALFLTALTLVPGIGLTLKGASRWIAIGGFTFQPVELLKFASVLFLGALYAANFRAIETFKKGLLPLLLVGGTSAGVLLLQPSTGGAAIILLATGAMYFAAGGRVSYLALLAVGGLLALGLLALARPYVLERIQTYLHHTEDPLGAGWQTQQSLIAVGSGGLSGRGFGQSVEKFSYLPEPIGDSIFAVAAEEFGFIGSIFLLCLFGGFGFLGLRIASRSPDPFGGLIVVGLVILIVGQSFFNMAATLGLVPLSGLPLIFVSHGGTALAVALAEVGVILSVSRRMRN
jgi:cell division protein FtsW